MNYFFKYARDPISSLSHYLGAGLSVLATLAFLIAAIAKGDSALTLISVLVFGLSLVALYTASGYYHFIKTSPAKEKIFRKVDHAMIYVLIAGTYTPICLKFMPGAHGIIFTVAIWSVALLGIITKLYWINAPRWLSTSIYLLMGWAIIFDIKAFSGIPALCTTLIAAGGVAYSVGAIIYILKKPNFSPHFGFHELFHIFILLGSFFHFSAVWFFVV